jgi:pyrroloquinoline quinone biosynthesis protein B
MKSTNTTGKTMTRLNLDYCGSPIVVGLMMVLSIALPMPGQENTNPSSPFLCILGITQDGGHPHAGCQKGCCEAAFKDRSLGHHVVCLGLIDPASSKRWMFDATPDFKYQLKMLDDIVPANRVLRLDGIFLTHAHIGHYTGLMDLGREVMGTKNIPVYAMPKMHAFLSSNGPWDQLIRLQNIKLTALADHQKVTLTEQLSIEPLLVPHRDEYSETVGYLIHGPNKSGLFIPDIDKWDRWDTRIESVLAHVDYAFLDGSFFANGEIAGRDMSEIPHPFIEESMAHFGVLPDSERSKIHFIHFNHTNPVLDKNSKARKIIIEKGFNIAEELAIFEL